MPISVWLNRNISGLNEERWPSFISDVQEIFSSTFKFSIMNYELWDKSFFEDSGGDLVVSTEKFNEGNTFSNFISRALKEKLILKITGKMENPVTDEAFAVFFLDSDDRWDMPHIFFDTGLSSKPLTDILWDLPISARNDFVMGINDSFHQITVDAFGKPSRIVDTIAIAKDFPDSETMREPGVILYYLSGKETRFLNNLIRQYGAESLENGKKISVVNINTISKELYADPFFEKIWKRSSKSVKAIPGGSLTLLSETVDGIPNLLNGLQSEIIAPFVDQIPLDLYNNIMMKVKAKIKLD